MQEDLPRLVQGDRQQLLFVGDVAKVLALLHIWPVTTVVGSDRFAVGRIDAECARQLQQLLGLFDRHPLEHHGLEQAGHPRLVETGRQVVGRAPLHVGAVAAVLGEHRIAVELADRLVALRQCQQFQGHLDGELVGGEVVGNAGGVVAALDVWAVLSGLDHDQVAVGVVADRKRVDLRGVDLVEVLFDEPLETRQILGLVAEVEVLQPILLLELVAGDRVEVFLDARGERVVDQSVEVLLQQPDDSERSPRGHEGLTLLPHISAVLHRLDDRCPGRWPADAEFFEPLDQRCFGVSSGRRCCVTVGSQRLHPDRSTDSQRRQEGLALFVAGLGVVDRFDIDLPVAGEADRGATGREHGDRQGIVIARVDCRGRQPNCHGDACCVGHLGGQGALPDHPVHRQLLAVQLCGQSVGAAQRCRRTDGLVCFLSVLGLRRELSRRRREELVAIAALDLGANSGQRFIAEGDVVGSHVGDVAALVQALRHTHHL